jgi:hypothetical protein
VLARKQEEVLATAAAAKDAALPLGESKSARTEEIERTAFIPLISAKLPSAKGPPAQVVELTEPKRKDMGGRKTRKKRKTRRR